MSTVKPQQIVLASGNPGKLKEFQQLFSALTSPEELSLKDQHRGDIEVLPQSAFDTPSVEETGLTFVENAILKARFACEHTGLPALADDSGLAVDALGGAPGIYSARFAGTDASDADNNERLLQDLINVPDEKRSARFICLLVFMRHANDPTPLICQGSWEGRILHAARGENGFGYDPLFFVPEKNCCSAELSKTEKNAISHRSKAMALLLNALRDSYALSTSLVAAPTP